MLSNNRLMCPCVESTFSIRYEEEKNGKDSKISAQ